MSEPTTSNPVDLFRCPTCTHHPLTLDRAQGDRVYCSQCGSLYERLSSGAIQLLPENQLASLSPAQSVAHNDVFAWAYERIWRPNALTILSGQLFPLQREADLLASLMSNADPVLDLGAASGFWSRSILERSPSTTVIALDNSSQLLAEARRRALPHWTNYSLVQAQAEALPFRDATFAAVVSGGSLNELSFEATLNEVARVLQPEGVFISMHIQQVSGVGQSIQRWVESAGLKFYSEAQIRQQCARVGLTLKRYLVFGAIAFVQARRDTTTPSNSNHQVA